MYRFDVRLVHEPPKAKGQRAAELMTLFGIRRSQLKRQVRRQRVTFQVGAGQIVFIAGASGAGKSRLLGALYAQAPAGERLMLHDIPLEDGLSAIDCIERDPAGLSACLHAMNKAALADVFCMLRSPRRLSEGQQARYRLARALAGARRLIFADEFTSSLDRVTALAVAYHVRKTATRSGKSFILASCHEDIIEELRPDKLFRL